MKLVKKFKAVLLVFTLVVCTTGTMSVNAAERHIVPGTESDPQYCTNIYRTYAHSGYYSSIAMGNHLISGATYCQITGLIYYHSIRCSSCGAQLATKQTIQCTTEHSKCGTRVVNHPAY